MKKWIFPLLLLLTVLLLISLAFLPALAGMIQDADVEKAVSYRPLHSIAPYIDENGSGLTVTEKLQILQTSESSAIVPAMASMNAQQVRAAVEEGLQPYLEAGIFRPFSEGKFYATPYVAINWQDVSRWFLSWDITLVDMSGETMHTFTGTLDDETGKFLMMYYVDPYTKEAWQTGEEHCPPLELFSQSWLEQAGLWDSASKVTAESEAQQIQDMHPGMCVTVYAIHDGVLPPFYMCFSVSGNGDYTMWVENMSQMMRQ